MYGFLLHVGVREMRMVMVMVRQLLAAHQLKPLKIKCQRELKKVSYLMRSSSGMGYTCFLLQLRG